MNELKIGIMWLSKKISFVAKKIVLNESLESTTASFILKLTYYYHLNLLSLPYFYFMLFQKIM